MANHGIVYPARRPRVAGGIYCVRLHHYFEILRWFSLAGLGALPRRVSLLPPLRVCVGHKFTFMSKVGAFMDSLYLGNIRFQWEMHAVEWENLQFLPGLLKSSLGLECLNPNRKSGSNWGQVTNFYLREKTVICSLDIFQWNVLRRRIYFPTDKIFLFW